MKKVFAISFGALIFCSVAFAGTQEDPPKSAIAHRDYRAKPTEPTFGLAKVKAILSKYKVGMSEEPTELPPAVWNKLSTPEKFTYCMLRGEAFSQNCDAIPINVKEESVVYGNPIAGFTDERAWSPRQIAWMKANRKEVVRLAKETIKTRQRTGANLRELILQLNAKELIPDVLAAYAIKKKDHDALSLVSSMMKEANFGPYVKTKIYAEFYGDDKGYYHAVPYSKSLHAEIKALGLMFAKTK